MKVWGGGRSEEKETNEGGGGVREGGRETHVIFSKIKINK